MVLFAPWPPPSLARSRKILPIWGIYRTRVREGGVPLHPGKVAAVIRTLIAMCVEGLDVYKSRQPRSFRNELPSLSSFTPPPHGQHHSHSYTRTSSSKKPPVFLDIMQFKLSALLATVAATATASAQIYSGYVLNAVPDKNGPPLNSLWTTVSYYQGGLWIGDAKTDASSEPFICKNLSFLPSIAPSTLPLSTCLQYLYYSCQGHRRPQQHRLHLLARRPHRLAKHVGLSQRVSPPN